MRANGQEVMGFSGRGAGNVDTRRCEKGSSEPVEEGEIEKAKANEGKMACE